MNTIKGAIKLINPTRVISDKFSVREFVISVPEGKYTQEIIFQLTNDRLDLIEQYGQGQEVEVSYNIRGREYQGKYYNTLDAWKIQPVGQRPSQASTQPIELDDDLPF